MIVAVVLMDLVGLFAAGNSNTSCGDGGPARSGSACAPVVPTGPGGQAVTDNLYLVHQSLTGDGSITVRISSLTGLSSDGNAVAHAGQDQPAGLQPGVQPWSKAGIIIKQSTTQGSAYAAMMVTGGHGVRMQYNYTEDRAGLPGAVSPASPRWLRLTRAGDTITGYDSTDGTHWRAVGRAHLAGLPASVQVGLFAASPDHNTVVSFFGGSSMQGGPTLATGVFDHAVITPAAPTEAWTGTAIGGSSGPPQLGQRQGFQHAGDRFTVTGSGDIVPVVPGAAAGAGPVATIGDHLLGAFSGLIVIVVIATMLMTAEYRRGMIRTTLAASPRRGRVLVAKAAVIGPVTFTVGLPAALIAVTVGVRLSRDQGSYVLPVPWPTEVRVIVGTAALLAVTAVLALAVGAVLRRSAAAVATVIVGIVLPYILGTASVLPIGAAQWLLRVTPAAAFAIQQSIPAYPQVTAGYTPPAYFPLSPWAGFAVLCGYTAVALSVAAILLRRRDA
jgi:ABC-type transport system involved in multi-copper enzyme maturation permease subunit